MRQRIVEKKTGLVRLPVPAADSNQMAAPSSAGGATGRAVVDNLGDVRRAYQAEDLEARERPTHLKRIAAGLPFN